jgi:hypothetical protein
VPPLDRVDDDEFVLRRIPPGTTWQAPGPRITSRNFELRRDSDETGVSVSRRKITSPEALLLLIPSDIVLRMGPVTEWRVAHANVGEIRKLGFNVEPDPLPDDPGHALIASASSSLDDASARKDLARLFSFIDTG